MADDNKTYYLSNEPSGEDCIAGGAADRIAAALARQLMNPDMIRKGIDGNVTYPVSYIGLEGAWGTGKSTIIELAKQKLNSSVTLVTYDLWSHRLELSRAKLLESVVGDLCNRGVLEKAYLARLHSLTAEQTITYYREAPAVSWLGIIYAVCLASTSLSHYAGNWWLKCLPAIVGALAFLSSVCGDVFRRKTSVKEALARALYISKNEKLDGKIEERVEKAESGINEYQKFFKDIVAESGSKPLALVFDNMDRLTNPEIRDFWSAIHILFAGPRDKTPWRLRVIVPFDGDRVSAAFSEGNAEYSTGRDYILRTFDVVYRVNAPRSMAWREFFEAKFKLAMEADDKLINQMGEALHVFELANGTPESVSPRRIIAFIDQIKTVLDVAGAEAPALKIVALYLCFWAKSKVCGAQTEEELIASGDFISDPLLKSEYASSSDCVAMAALVFQVPRNEAKDVMVHAVVKDALEKGGSAVLETMRTSALFDRAFNKAILSIKDVNKAAYAMSCLRSDTDNKYWSSFYKLHREEILKLPRDHVGSVKGLSVAQANMLRYAGEWKEFTMALHIQAFKEGLNIESKDSSYINFIYRVEEALKKGGRSQAGIEDRIKLDPEPYLNLMWQLASRSPLTVCTADVSSLDFFALKCISVGEFSRIRALKYLNEKQVSEMWNARTALKNHDEEVPRKIDDLEAYLDVREALGGDFIEVAFTPEIIRRLADGAFHAEGPDRLTYCARAIAIALEHGIEVLHPEQQRRMYDILRGAPSRLVEGVMRRYLSKGRAKLSLEQMKKSPFTRTRTIQEVLESYLASKHRTAENGGGGSDLQR